MGGAASGDRVGIATGPDGSQRCPTGAGEGEAVARCIPHGVLTASDLRGLTVPGYAMRDARHQERARPPGGEGRACCYLRLRASPSLPLMLNVTRASIASRCCTTSMDGGIDWLVTRTASNMPGRSRATSRCPNCFRETSTEHRLPGSAPGPLILTTDASGAAQVSLRS